jgi:hypothetical protein
LSHKIESAGGAVHLKMLDEITTQQFLQNECGHLRIAVLVGDENDVASFV